jgi:hypothetical protein
MKLDEKKQENLAQLLARLVTLIVFLTFASSLTLARVWKLEKLIQTQTEETK